jgi:23S rRNA A2030 N6-methylase RlmJ
VEGFCSSRFWESILADKHNQRVGNKADVWKHFILCGVVDALLRGHTDKQSFIYVDTHCSLGHFPLPENGQWKQGIGLFYGRKWPLADQPYFVIEQKAYERDRSYLGSWKLVESLLTARNIQREFRLFDKSDLVAEQLKEVPGFSHSDGFDGIVSNLLADLYLVDPAYSDHPESDWGRVRKVSEKFRDRSATALIWYPVYVKKRNVENLAGVVVAEVRWPATGANQIMRGCGMIALGVSADILSEMQNSLVELAAVLSGSLSLRDKRT